MKTQHTPGKWEIVREDYDDDFPIVYVTIKDDNRRICEVYNDWLPEDDANARLIAAASDLLDVLDPDLLEEAAAYADAQVGGNIIAADLYMLADRTRDAIAKATNQAK